MVVLISAPLRLQEERFVRVEEEVGLLAEELEQMAYDQ
jgi:hypothetical protein